MGKHARLSGERCAIRSDSWGDGRELRVIRICLSSDTSTRVGYDRRLATLLNCAIWKMCKHVVIFYAFLHPKDDIAKDRKVSGGSSSL